METPKEYYYTYYSYEEWGRGYFGSRKCKCLPEKDVKYFGSFKDKTFKPKCKIILKDDYATREEAYADEILLQEYYKVVENPHFANMSYQTSTKFYVPTEQAIENGRKVGQRNKENKTGVCGLSPKKRSELGKRNGIKSREEEYGIFGMDKNEKLEAIKKGGKTTGTYAKENNKGIFSLTEEQKIKNCILGGKIAGKIVKKEKKGIFGLTEEQRKENAILGGTAACKIINAQRWECCETGYVSTPAGVVSYQRIRGIDTSKSNRRRIS
jgi:hypothetical protein